MSGLDPVVDRLQDSLLGPSLLVHKVFSIDQHCVPSPETI